MIEKPYNAEKLTSYLLGSSSPEETEEFDELSLTDSDFADALLEAESDLVDAYVLGELPDHLRRRFESSYLATDRTRSTVRFAEAFQLWGQTQVRPSLHSEKSDRTLLTRAPWYVTLKSLFDFRPALQWGLAICALLLLTIGIFLAFQIRSLRQQLLASQTQATDLANRQKLLAMQLEEIKTNTPQMTNAPRGVESTPSVPDSHRSPAILSVTLQPPLRGNQQTPSIALNSETKIVAVRLELEPNDFSSFRVTLFQQNRRLWQSGRLNSQGDANGNNVVVRVPSSLFKSGVVVFRVSGVSANGSNEIIGDYAVQIR